MRCAGWDATKGLERGEGNGGGGRMGGWEGWRGFSSHPSREVDGRIVRLEVAQV